MVDIQTELKNGMPNGWYKKFGKKMATELAAIVEEKEIDDFEILQVKEKYNTLRVYVAPYDEDVENLLRKYEYLSTKYCVCCGKKATKVSTGWYNSFCDGCYEENFGNDKEFITIQEWLNPKEIRMS